MRPTQILLSSLLISLALSQALQKQSGFALIETHQIEENQADLIRSNALSEELITELIARLNEDEAQPKTSEKKLSQSSQGETLELGFLDGWIIGLQVHSDAESACLASYRYHKDVVNTAFSNMFAFNRDLFFQALLNLTNLVSNLDSLIENCQVQNFIYFTANTVTIPGFASLVTRLARNLEVITELMSTADFNQSYSVGLFLGTFVSVLVGFTLP